MPIRYAPAPDVEAAARQIAKKLAMKHLDFERMGFLRSYGSTSNAVARCYGLSKVWQRAFKWKAHYVIEVVAERFDKLSDRDKIKTVIHELLHVPKCFGGGFRHHNVVNQRNIDELYKKLMS